MEKMTLWDHETEVKFPNGQVYTAEQVKEEYPAQTDGVCVLEWVSPSIVGGIDNLEILKDIYKIDAALSDEEALAAIIEAKYNPPEPAPTAEERIAAAMEYQNLMNM